MTQSGSLMSDDHEDGKWAVGEDFQIPTVIPMSSYQAGKAIVRQGMEHKTMMLEVRTYLIVEFFLIFSYALGNIPSWAYWLMQSTYMLYQNIKPYEIKEDI